MSEVHLFEMHINTGDDNKPDVWHVLAPSAAKAMDLFFEINGQDVDLDYVHHYGLKDQKLLVHADVLSGYLDSGQIKES